jgi:hypothetical protein
VGRILGRFDLGDHVGFLLAPEEVQIDHETDPVGFQEMPDVEPGHPAE